MSVSYFEAAAVCFAVSQYAAILYFSCIIKSP